MGCPRGPRTRRRTRPECYTHAESEISGECHGGGEEVGTPPASRSCRSRRVVGRSRRRWRSNSWEHPEAWSDAVSEIPPVGECERVPFEPTIEVQPYDASAESPTGLDVSLVVPQTWENPDSLASSNLKDTKVTLPGRVSPPTRRWLPAWERAPQHSTPRKRRRRCRVKGALRNRRSGRSKSKHRC